MVELLQVLEGLAYLSFIAGAIFAVMQLREMAKDRRTELAMRMTEQWCSLEFQEAAAAFLKARFSTAEEAEKQISLPALLMGASFFERLGYMARNKLVPIDMILETMPVEYCWEKVKPWARGTDFDDPERAKYPRSTYPNYEWLAGEDRKRRLAAEP